MTSPIKKNSFFQEETKCSLPSFVQEETKCSLPSFVREETKCSLPSRRHLPIHLQIKRNSTSTCTEITYPISPEFSSEQLSFFQNIPPSLQSITTCPIAKKSTVSSFSHLQKRPLHVIIPEDVIIECEEVHFTRNSINPRPFFSISTKTQRTFEKTVQLTPTAQTNKEPTNRPKTF